MHELGIVYQIVKTVDEIKQEQNLESIEAITLQIGEMSDIVPKFIEEAWQATKPTTSYPDADMIVEVIPAMAECCGCGYTDKVRNIGLTCPHCSSPDFKIISGREFMIKEIIAK